jgi:RND family efflux transporter MFP subunit
LRKFLKALVPILLVAAGVGAAGLLVATRPAPVAKPAQERAWLVDAATVAFEDVQPELTLYGEVVAGREVSLRALVAGEVARVAESFLDGADAAAGEVLVTIDPFDFEQDVIERRAQLDEARARRTEMRGRLEAERAMLGEAEAQVEINRRDVARRESLLGNAVSERGLDEAKLTLSRAESELILRREAASALEAQIDQQNAVIARLEAALARAERALADTELKAPFAGYLADTAAQPGERLAVGDRVARLIDPTRLEVRFHMSEDDFGRLFAGPDGAGQHEARVVWRVGNRALAFDAVIARQGSEIDPTTGGVTLYARVRGADRRGLELLRPGAFVEVIVPDRMFRQVARLPATALYGETTVYAVVEGRLEPRKVALLRRVDGEVLVTGEIAAGDVVATTRFTEIGPGVKVAIR